MSAPDGTVDLELRDDGLAVITLNRPRRLNALNVDMRDALWSQLLAIRDDPDIAGAVIRGAGPHFSVGADLREFGTAESLFAARWVRFARPLWELLWSMPKPLVAALKGYTLGSGLEIALMCDVRIASPDIRAALPEAQFGMIPAGGGTQSLTRVAGISRALSLILGAGQMSAPEALRAGVIDAIDPDPEAAAVSLALTWGKMGPIRAAIGKLAIRAAIDLPPAEARKAEQRLAALLRDLAVP